MKLNSQCQLHTVSGEHIILQPATTTGADIQVIAFNDTAKMLWESLLHRDFQTTDVAELLQHQYEIDTDTAMRDAQNWVDTLVKNHLIFDQ